MKKSIRVINPASGRVVKVKVSAIWRDYCDTVNQFDDLNEQERAKQIADTLINRPEYWRHWYCEHIGYDWPYILTIGKVVKKANRKLFPQFVRDAEHGTCPRITK